MTRRCDQRTRWGRCPVEGRVRVSERKVLCAFHHWWSLRDDEPDPRHHERIILGIITPVSEDLTETEIRATLHGRSRGDGRRLDAYCLEDPIDGDLEV